MYYCISRISVPIPVAARSKAWAWSPRFLAWRVRIPPGPWMPVSCGCCVLSGRGLCDDPITRPEASCRLSRACVCVSLSGIRCNSNPQQLQWEGRRCQNKKEFLLLDSVSGECHQSCNWKRQKYEYCDAHWTLQWDLKNNYFIILLVRMKIVKNFTS